MKYKLVNYLIICFFIIWVTACKSDEMPAVGACSGVTIEIDIKIVLEATCESDATIELVATGGTSPYTYSKDAVNFQQSNKFDVELGTISVTVKDANGCTANKDMLISTSAVSLANDIMPIINTSCAISGCHLDNDRLPMFISASAIIANSEEIKARTSARTMPPDSRPELPQETIDKIACWVDGGALDN